MHFSWVWFGHAENLLSTSSYTQLTQCFCIPQFDRQIEILIGLIKEKNHCLHRQGSFWFTGLVLEKILQKMAIRVKNDDFVTVYIILEIQQVNKIT